MNVHAADAQTVNAAPSEPLAARFEKPKIETTAEPGVQVVDLCYEFTNTGDLPLAVEEFAQSCGCMAGEWDGVPVKPGEKGKITAKFLTQGLRGKVSKRLGVKFVGCGSVELVAVVEISNALVCSDQTLHWTVGESPNPKQVDISINAKTPLQVLSVAANDPHFSCEVRTITASRKYQILITPSDTAKERVCVLQVRTDSKDPRDALVGLFALVEKPKPEGGAP